MNKLTIFLVLTLLTVSSVAKAQQLLRGKVIYKNIAVPNENVINATTEIVTSTDDEGEFQIMVSEDDILAFSAVNYKFKTIVVTSEILSKNRLVVEVNEKVMELDEVVITPEDREKFIELKQEEFKKVDYEQDLSTAVENTALPQSVRGMENGINFVNIFKAIFKSQKEKEVPFKERIKVSQVLRQVYDDEFFVVDLKLPQDKIDAFLFYCDDKVPAETLLKKENEFILIDVLVTQSKNYLKEIASE